MSDEQDQINNEEEQENTLSIGMEQEVVRKSNEETPYVYPKDLASDNVSSEDVPNEEVDQGEKKPPKVRWI